MREEIFRGIADPLRRAILDLLRTRPRPVEEIAGHFPVSRPAISKHLRVLREAGLVVEEKSGRQRFYALAAAQLAPAREWLEALAGPGPEPGPGSDAERSSEPPARRAPAGSVAPRPAAPRNPDPSRPPDRSEPSREEPLGEDWRSW
jgi:DNA-binding transcriptional ArsR family regulator